MSNILDQFSDKINGLFSFFDRMIITGWLRPFLAFERRANALYNLGIPLKAYKEKTIEITGSIRQTIERTANEMGRPILKHDTSKRMEEEALKVLKENPVEEGLVCVIRSTELCYSAKVYGSDEGKLVLKPCQTKCLQYYLYYVDKSFGFMFVKIQTWFPFPIVVYINGRELLKKKFDESGIKYTMYDNSFSTLSDIVKAQEIADSFESNKLCRQLDKFAYSVNPFLRNITDTFGSNAGYYWCLQQCEYATDIMFKNRKVLEDIYPSLVGHTFYDLNCTDVFSFMGRKLDARFQGEAVSDYKKRPIGWRVKFRLNTNSIKMYDKANCLRIELTINNPRDFKIYKDVHHKNGTTSKEWVPMSKSISNIYRYAQIGKECNNRFIAALNDIVPVGKTIKEIEKVCSRRIQDGNVVTAFNVWSPETFLLFETICDGKFLINGFTNKDIRDTVFPDIKDESKRSSAMSRQLRKLRLHELIRKVPHSRIYLVSKKGRRVMGGLNEAKRKMLPDLEAEF